MLKEKQRICMGTFRLKGMVGSVTDSSACAFPLITLSSRSDAESYRVNLVEQELRVPFATFSRPFTSAVFL
jgi:hypothetical protein